MLCGGLSQRLFFPALICTLMLPALARDARAAFEVVSHNASVDEIRRRTTFTVTFNESPDFFTTNELGEPDNAFQFFYDSEPAGDEIDFAGEDVVIIRGAEIRFDDNIPIRDSLNPGGEEFPNAEGWGEMLGSVDYELDGTTITFAGGWDVLRETDGVFGYRLFAFEQAELTNEVIFLSRILVPLPPAVLLGTVGLASLARFRCRRKCN